jgi:hypothetical protein
MPNKISSLLKPVPESAIFQHPDWYIWGGSMTQGPDGKYYLLYARWPRRFKHGAWLTHSEVAVAIADAPHGPFRHLRTALPVRDEHYFDAWCTHNPTVHCFDRTWYLYYMGTKGPREWIESHPEGGNVPQEIRMRYQANQRIGVATAPHPAGPWTRQDEPLIDRGAEGMPDERMVSNPSVCRRPDGSYLMIYKCSEGRDPLQKQGNVVHLVATAEHPSGPFTKTYQSAFTAEGVTFPAEDPYIWYDNKEGRYFAVLKDMCGAFSDAGRSVVLFSSLDGFDWKPCDDVLVTDRSLRMADGSIQAFKHLERPQLYIENGTPRALCFAADMDRSHSCNIQVPLKPPHSSGFRW